MNIKKSTALVLLIALIALAGCSSTKPDPNNAVLILDKEVQPLGRNEVINGIGECESNGMRAVLIFSKRKINGYTSDVVVDVTCAPRFKI